MPLNSCKPNKEYGLIHIKYFFLEENIERKE